MKTLNSQNITFQACKCPNQHLLETGEICEICMGVVDRPDFLDQFPEVKESDPFDQLYFEELESYYEDIDYAA